MKLFEIAREYRSALENLVIDEETGAIEGMEAVEELQGDLILKGESVALYIKELEAFAADIKAEERKLKERREQAEKKVEYFKTYLSSCLDGAELAKLETARVRVSFRKSVAVDIIDESALPTEFFKIVEDVRIDKTAIKKAIDSGAEVAGATLRQNRSLQIK
jgi:hypothetical protein